MVKASCHKVEKEWNTNFINAFKTRITKNPKIPTHQIAVKLKVNVSSF